MHSSWARATCWEKRGHKKRGIEILRCGARTLTVHLHGERAGQKNPYPRRRLLGVCAPQRRNLLPRSLLPRSLLPRPSIAFFLMALFSLAAAPYAAPNSAKPAAVTTYAQMTTRLQADAKQSSLVRLASLGKSAGGTRQLWLVRIADPATDPTQAKRILILCRQHGDEPASTEALLRLVHGVATGGDQALRAELSHVTLYVVPMVNPDGAGANTRRNANGADLNRDWGRFTQPETGEVAAAVKLISPSLIVDAHNWDGSDEYNADCLEVPREMETALGRAAHAWQRQAIGDLAASGYAVHPTAWGNGADPHLAHRWFTHEAIPSVLVETHYGPPTDRADFERREGLYTALVHSLAKRYSSPWTVQPSAVTHEAALFSVPTVRGTGRQSTSKMAHSARWVWALGLYALAVWGMSLRGREKEPAKPKRPAPPRYSCLPKPIAPTASGKTLLDPCPAAARGPGHRQAQLSASRRSSFLRHPL